MKIIFNHIEEFKFYVNSILIQFNDFSIYKSFTKLLSLYFKFLILLFLCKLQPVAISFLTNGIRLIKEAYYKRTNCGFIHYDIERVSKERYVTCSRHAITFRP